MFSFKPNHDFIQIAAGRILFGKGSGMKINVQRWGEKPTPEAIIFSVFLLY
jgi:hypothetical protein